MAPVAVLLSSTHCFHCSSDHMDTAQPSELACLPQEPQSHNEAQDLLLLQDYVYKLTHTLVTLEDTHALLQQTEFLAGVINEQDGALLLLSPTNMVHCCVLWFLCFASCFGPFS